MRMDQPQGLPRSAVEFLREYEVPPPYCDCCGRPFARDITEIGTYEGFDEHGLYRYKLKDGRTADEFLQASHWSSGPMFFVGLKVSDGTIFKWGDDEILETQ